VGGGAHLSNQEGADSAYAVDERSCSASLRLIGHGSPAACASIRGACGHGCSDRCRANPGTLHHQRHHERVVVSRISTENPYFCAYTLPRRHNTLPVNPWCLRSFGAQNHDPTDQHGPTRDGSLHTRYCMHHVNTSIPVRSVPCSPVEAMSLGRSPAGRRWALCAKELAVRLAAGGVSPHLGGILFVLEARPSRIPREY
jgi:hypothetical protein